MCEVVRDEQVRNSTQCHLDPVEKGLLFDSQKLSNNLISYFTYRYIYIFYELWSLRRQGRGAFILPHIHVLPPPHPDFQRELLGTY